MIRLENVCVSYNKKEIIKNINFKIGYNESLSIIGPNGCGKTTLLKAILNVVDFKGNIFIKGKNVKEYKMKELAKEISMFSQVNQIYFNYTVFDIVMMGRYVYNDKFSICDKKEDIKKVEEALHILGIFNIKDREINTLSGGQIQRVFLAKIIAQDTDIILLDEPTNHLDLKYQVETIKFLKSWANKKGKSIIGVLHDINLAMLLTDNIMLMDNGKIRSFGKLKEVIASNDINEVYKINVKEYMLKSLKKWNNI